MTTRRPTQSEVDAYLCLLAAVKAERRSRQLRESIINALLIIAGIVGTGGLLYFRAEVWAWLIGDPVSFAVILIMLAIGSVLTVRAARERDGVEP